MTRPRGDAGQVMLLAVFFGLVAGLFAAVVVDASAAFLARRELAAVADGAALAAAQAVDLDAYYAGTAAHATALPLGDVTRAAADYVAAHAPGVELAGVELRDSGRAVAVAVRRRVRFPLATVGFPAGVDVGAEAVARLAPR